MRYKDIQIDVKIIFLKFLVLILYNLLRFLVKIIHVFIFIFIFYIK